MYKNLATLLLAMTVARSFVCSQEALFTAIKEDDFKTIKSYIQENILCNRLSFYLAHKFFTVGCYEKTAQQIILLLDPQHQKRISDHEDFHIPALNLLFPLVHYYPEYLHEATITKLKELAQEHASLKTMTTLSCKEMCQAFLPIDSVESAEHLQALVSFYPPINTELARYFIEHTTTQLASSHLKQALMFGDFDCLAWIEPYAESLLAHWYAKDYESCARALVYYCEQATDPVAKQTAFKILTECANQRSATASIYLFLQADASMRRQCLPNLFNACFSAPATFVVPLFKKYKLAEQLEPFLDPARSTGDFLCAAFCAVVTAAHPKELSFSFPTFHTANVLAPSIDLDLSTTPDFLKSSEAKVMNGKYFLWYGPKLKSGYTAPVHLEWVDDAIGFGVFADKDIVKDELIGEYIGSMRPGAEKQLNPYIFTFKNPDILIDAGQEVWNCTRFINHAQEPNSDWLKMHYDGQLHVCIVASKPIAKGQEITINYGQKYWEFTDPL